MVKPLLTLEKAGQGTVVAIDGDASFSERLKEMGFIPGSPVSLLSKMAFGGPISFKVQNTKVALRRDDAARVMVSVPA